MMIARQLPREEWPRLIGTELETIWPHLNEDAQVLVVEADNEVLGCWAVYPLIHVEGLWIHPLHRGMGGVARRLWLAMCSLVSEMGARVVQTGAVDPAVAALLQRAGAVELLGRHFALPMKGITKCQLRSQFQP